MWIISITALVAVVLLGGSHGEAATMYASRFDWESEVLADGITRFAETNIASQVPDLSTLSAGSPITMYLNYPLFFDITLTGRQVPSSWPSWSGGNTPAVLFTGDETSLSGSFLVSPQYEFGLEVQPEAGTQQITLLLDDGTSLTQLVSNQGGAAFFGFSDGNVTTWTLSCETCAPGSGFAMGRLVFGAPAPPALTLFVLGLVGLAGVKAFRTRRGR